MLPPSTVRTLGETFDHAAEHFPTQEIRSLLTDESITFHGLLRNGETVARGLLGAGAGRQVPIALLTQSSIGFLQALCGVVKAGAVAVPLSLPANVDSAYLTRLRRIVRKSGVRIAIVDEMFVGHLAELLPEVTAVTMSALADGGTRTEVYGVREGQGNGPADTPACGLPPVPEDDLAIIQYTSGSTSSPRGVALTHRNVMAGIRIICHGVGVRPGDMLSHWLPLSHDMGLFSTLAALGSGTEIRISSPRDFIKYPEDWLRAFCEARATITAGPDFSLRHLLEAVPAEKAAEYDLSALRVIVNGAEPIDPDLFTAFGRRFAPSGLAPEAMTPCYGLAEATLGVTFTPVGEEPTVDWVDKDALNGSGKAIPAGPGAPGVRGVVSCGVPVPGIEIRISEEGRDLPDRVVGDIFVRGEPVMSGYYQERVASVSPEGWCATGDLGYLADGCLHVTGRRKEMLIIGGRNYYPQDVEDTVRWIPGVHARHAVAVVLQADQATGAPARIGVLAEVSPAAPPHPEMVTAIRKAASAELGGATVDVVLLEPDALLRTPSGKFQRMLMRDQLQAETLSGVLLRVTAGSPLPAHARMRDGVDGPAGGRGTSSLA